MLASQKYFILVTSILPVMLALIMDLAINVHIYHTHMFTLFSNLFFHLFAL